VDDEEPKRQKCADCADESPPISTNYTLIGTHGWRLSKRTDAHGQVLVEWRCPSCWTAFKRLSQDGEREGSPRSRK
jgi:hypothetical protein